MLACHFGVARAASGRTYDDVADVPERAVALVLGTSKRVRGGQPNLYFQHRMAAAADLLHAGKVKHIIVSGDNRHKSYNEPTDMQKALVGLGVPASAITLDYAGFRTLDSVVRCKKVFSQDEIVVVSQEFHNERAIFIAQRFGIDAVGMNAADVPHVYRVKARIRECLARCKAVLDVYILGTQPKFLGEKVDVPV
ncbi:MAG: hypothetical protein GY851_28415 [bacterium]|nr:hypothetical protein [bacterium]